ncbi:MAG: HAD family phosphatase [Casimicrobium sp.]
MRRPLPAAVIFDMDGLLIDSERLARVSTLAVSEQLGHPIPESVAMRMIGLGSDALERMLRAELGAQFPLTPFRDAWNAHYGALVEQGVPVKPGVVEALTALAAANVRCAVATSTQTRLAQHKLEKAGLLHHFAFVAGRDTVAHGKPAPDLYLHAAEQLGHRAERCWAFEDSLPGLTAAAASGARTHWVPDLAHIHANDLPAGVETIDSLHHVSRWVA